jgi:hypothetical protein
MRTIFVQDTLGIVFSVLAIAGRDPTDPALSWYTLLHAPFMSARPDLLLGPPAGWSYIAVLVEITPTFSTPPQALTARATAARAARAGCCSDDVTRALVLAFPNPP